MLGALLFFHTTKKCKGNLFIFSTFQIERKRAENENQNVIKPLRCSYNFIYGALAENYINEYWRKRKHGSLLLCEMKWLLLENYQFQQTTAHCSGVEARKSSPLVSYLLIM